MNPEEKSAFKSRLGELEKILTETIGVRSEGRWIGQSIGSGGGNTFDDRLDSGWAYDQFSVLKHSAEEREKAKEKILEICRNSAGEQRDISLCFIAERWGISGLKNIYGDFCTQESRKEIEGVLERNPIGDNMWEYVFMNMSREELREIYEKPCTTLGKRGPLLKFMFHGLDREVLKDIYNSSPKKELRRKASQALGYSRLGFFFHEYPKTVVAATLSGISALTGAAYGVYQNWESICQHKENIIGTGLIATLFLVYFLGEFKDYKKSTESKRDIKRENDIFR